MKFYSYYIILLLIGVALASCTDDKCNADTETLLTASLTVNDTELKSKKYLDSLSVYSPLWPDSIHYISTKGGPKISFMLSPISDTSEIVFTSKSVSLNDTLFIFYQRNYTLYSQECGFVTQYKIDTILHSYNYIDSVEITNKEISIEKDGQIQIYF